MQLKGKRAIVTGAGRGIGRAIALRYAKEGASVLVANRTLSVAQEVVEEITAAGGTAAVCQVDVSDAAQVRAMVDEAVSRFGGIDILVANAGICEPEDFLEISEDSWDRHMDINLKGVFLSGQAVARHMVEAGIRGRIINMTSVNGLAAEAQQAHYNTTKGGITLLTMSMAIELAQHGINVNGIAPGFVDTRLTRPVIDVAPLIDNYVKSIPMRRYGTPEEMTGAAVFLASEDSAYVNGHVLVVDGGQLINLSPYGEA